MMVSELCDLIENGAYAEVKETLQFLLEECSSDTAPTREEVVQWQNVLEKRGAKFGSLVNMCAEYLAEITENRA